METGNEIPTSLSRPVLSLADLRIAAGQRQLHKGLDILRLDIELSVGDVASEAEEPEEQ